MVRYGNSTPPIALWLITFAYLVYTLGNSPNFAISLPVFLYPIIIYRLFWISAQPNVLFWGLMYQWLAVSTQLFYCNFLGIAMAEYMQNQGYPVELFNYTIMLSIIALYFYAFGLFLAVKNLIVGNIDAALLKYSPKRLFQWYIIISVIIYLSRAIIWSFPGLVQYFYFLFYIKWGFFLITFYTVHKRAPELRLFLYFIILIEVVLGLVSFFSDAFLNVLIFSFIGITTLQPKIKFAGFVVLIAMVVIFFNIAVYWTASKQEYRQFLNKGETNQKVSVSQGDALTKLSDLVSNVDDKQYQTAIRNMVDRIGYVQYFDATLGYVPAKVPHQYGAVYAKALEHYLIPRFLDNTKEALDDSKHTNEYTGLGLSGVESATSFSLGTVADAYIDYGEIFMFVPIFIFGYLMGSCYSFLWRKNPNQVWAWVLTGAFYLLINIYGADTTKAIGFILIYFFTIVLVKGWLIRILEPRLRA